MTGPIDVHVKDHIATVVMNRPPVNAQNVAFREAIIMAFDEISDRDDVRVAILTGIGNVFSAGADLKDRAGLDSAGEYWRHSRRVREAFNAIQECAKPVIAAVNGPALGAGFVLMASCDIMLASDNAVFAMPEIDVGLAGGAAMLGSLFGKSVARQLFFTGARVSAAELHRLGVLSDCVTPERLLPRAQELAAQIAAKSPIGVVYAKHAFNTVANMPARDGYRFEQNVTHQLSKTEDAKEAKLAFIEKRPPVFRGR
jgi:enoyl-CoA hydratase